MNDERPFERTKPLPLSLYVHLPWCARKCPYCDFNSYRTPDKINERAYVEALLRDLDQDMPRVWGRRIMSIFLGGGTPSLFAPESIDALLSGIDRKSTRLNSSHMSESRMPSSA